MRFFLLLVCVLLICCKENNNTKQHFPVEHINQKLENVDAIKLYDDAISFSKSGDLEKAEDACLRAFEYEKSPIILNQLGIIESTKNNHQTSITYFKKSRALDSLYFPSYIAEARSYGILGQTEKAERTLIKLKNMTKSNYWLSYAELYLAVIYYNNQQGCEKVLKSLDKAKSIKNDIDLKQQYIEFEKKVLRNCQ